MLNGRNGTVTIFTDRGSRGGAAPKRQHVDKAMASARASQEALELADEAYKRARVARNELEHARGRWRAVAHLAVD